MTALVDALPLISAEDQARIHVTAREAHAHRALMHSLPAMMSVELGGAGGESRLPSSFNLAAWNLERCLFPEASAALLARHEAQIVLLSEMDSGMARTAQRNTTAEMAEALGFHYAYGVEFFEMDLGGPSELQFCTDTHNAGGWHGNAILSATPLRRVELIRLDGQGHWFSTDAGSAGDPEQPRVGGRMAIAAEVESEAGPLTVVTTHLESNADAGYRAAQFTRLLDAVEHFAGDQPIVIGGDLNTGNHLPPDFDWRRETLFTLAEARGFGWHLSPEGVTTRPSLITPHPTRRMRLDWFCTRGVQGEAGPMVAALDPEGTPLSDHECVMCNLRL